MKSKRERLEENKSLSQAHAALVAQNDERVAGTKVSHKIPTAIPLGDFEIDKLSDLANQFEIKRDLDRNITRYETTLADGTRSLVRDARKVTEPSKENKEMDPNSMKMLMIGTSRGALFLVDNCGFQGEEINKAREDLRILFNRHLSQDFSKMSTKERKQFIQDYNGQVMAIMKNNNIDKIPGIELPKDLDLASHAMNTHNRNSHISTITEVTTKNGDKSTVIETDVMALGVTSRQKQWMTDLSNGKTIPDPWYAGQSKFRQALVRDVVSNVMDANGQQNNIIPTQLRTLMPLAKNASLKVTAVMDGDKVVDVAENLHSGAIYCGVKAKTQTEKDDVQWQAQEMASQLSMFAPKGVSQLNQVDSMSPKNPFNTAEKKANNQAKKAMEAIGGLFTNTPLNVFRKISKNQTSGYDTVLKNIAAAMRAEKEVFNIPALNQYLEGSSKNKQAALEALSVLRSEASSLSSQEANSNRLKMLDAVEIAINARELMGKKPSIFEKNGNNNLILADHFSQLNMAVHGTNGALKAGLSSEGQAKLKEVPYMNFNCMSGKDRTGVAMFSASVRSVTNYIKDKFGSHSVEARDVAVSMNKSGHTQQVPSQNDVGTHGVKKETNTAQKTDIFKDNSISTSSASFNKFKHNEKAAFDREVEKPKAKSFAQRVLSSMSGGDRPLKR